MSIGMSQSPTGIPKIKIKSPKKDIKVYKLDYATSKKLPDILAAPGIVKQSSNDDLDKITQAWNRLKINALSKAIAISPEVGPCSIGPKSCKSSHSEFDNEPDESCVNLDLKNAVTSTPLKPKRTSNKSANENSKGVNNGDGGKQVTLDVSEIKPENANGFVNELCELEKVRSLCIGVIEEQVQMSFNREWQERKKLWLEDQERLKEKAEALKQELDKERLLRIQKQEYNAQNHMTQSKANALKKAELEKTYQRDHSKKVAETNEKMKWIEQKRAELEEKNRQRREELKSCITGIHELQVAYNKKYNQIGEIAKSCRNVSALNEKVLKEISKLKLMNELFLKLFIKCEEGKVVLADLRAAEKLVQEISSIFEIFSHHAGEINKSIEKQEEENLKKEQLAKEQKEKKAVRLELLQKLEKTKQQQIQQEEAAEREASIKKQGSSTTQLTEVKDCVSGESLKWYMELKQFLEDFEEKVKPLVSNDSLKKFRFECQKAVIVPVNAISPLDDLHLEDKLYKLSRLLQGAAVPLDNSLFYVTGHPLGQPFCMNLLAKKFVKQGEHAVSSKPEAAFAIAAVIVALWVEFPDFGRLLIAHFHRECPYLIPAFLPQYEGQTNEDYYRQLGYQYSEDGKVESQEKFLRRMSGVMRLYAAILVTPLKRSHHSAGRTQPHGVQEAWRWLAATLNLPPRADISATLIFDFLEVAGWLVYQAYGRQFSKLLEALCYQFFPLIQQATPDGRGGPVVRLKNFLEKIIKERKVPPPNGLLPPNFW